MIEWRPRPLRALRHEAISLLEIAVVPVAIAFAFPYEAVGFHAAVRAAPHGPSCALVVLSEEEERVALAAALVGRPELLVLDEPTSGLDPVSTKEVKTLVKALAKKGMTVLTTSHLLADSEDICDRVMILNRGKCAAEGKVSELGESLEEFFLAKVGSGDDFALADFLA